MTDERPGPGSDREREAGGLIKIGIRALGHDRGCEFAHRPEGQRETNHAGHNAFERPGQARGRGDGSLLLDHARSDAHHGVRALHRRSPVDPRRPGTRGTREPLRGHDRACFLTLALIAPTAFEVLVARVTPKSVVNYGLEKVRFHAPVRAGKRVRNRIRLSAVDDRGNGRYLVTIDNTFEIEGEIRPALQASALAIFMA